MALEGNTYILEFLFLERVKHWIFYLKDSENNPILLGERLTPNTPIGFQYLDAPLTGYFYFTPKSEVDPEVLRDDIRQITDFYNLFYIFDDGEE